MSRTHGSCYYRNVRTGSTQWSIGGDSENRVDVHYANIEGRESGSLVQNAVKACMFARYTRGPILEIACGRGGDAFKIKRFARLHIGMDLPLTSCRCKLRNPAGEYFAHDAREYFGNARCRGKQFKSACCMFALHYILESEDICRLFFRSLSKCVEIGGVFFGITTDWKKVAPVLDGLVESTFISATGEDAGSGFRRYAFSLPGSVGEDIQECMVYMPLVEGIAAEYGFVLELFCNMEGYLRRNSAEVLDTAGLMYGGDALKMREFSRSLSEDGSLSELYAMFAFRFVGVGAKRKRD